MPELQSHRRKFMVQLSAVPAGRPQTITVERENIRLLDGWVIFSDGPEYSVNTGLIAYPAHRVMHVEEVEILPDAPAQNLPPDHLAKLARADKNKPPPPEESTPGWKKSAETDFNWGPEPEDLRGL